jgi:hypothetical protein
MARTTKTGGSATQTETIAKGPKTSKVQKKKQPTKPKKVPVKFRLFSGTRGQEHFHRVGISSGTKDAKRLLDSILVTFLHDVLKNALILKDSLEEPTLQPRHVLAALRIHSNMDMLNTADKTKLTDKQKKAKKEKEAK